MSTELSQAQVANLNDNWLDLTGGTATNCVYTYPPSTSYGLTWTYSYPTKIRLTLTEVEKLRAAAKKDAKLKEVLRKFTHAIEIEVDFP